MTDTKFADLLVEEESHVGRQCDLAKAFLRMPEDMATEVREAMAGAASAAAIARTLQRLDYEVSEGSLRRCRRICKCWRPT